MMRATDILGKGSARLGAVLLLLLLLPRLRLFICLFVLLRCCLFLFHLLRPLPHYFSRLEPKTFGTFLAQDRYMKWNGRRLKKVSSHYIGRNIPSLDPSQLDTLLTL